MWELRSYFGLTFAQLTEMQTNWNTYYNEELQVILDLISTASETPYVDA